MSFEQAAVALENFTNLHNQYKAACDTEAVRAAEKAAADAELSLATAAREQSDTAAEAALQVLLDELRSIGITTTGE